MYHKVNSVILDWAGTFIDYGCFAPTQIFINIFAKLNITLTIEQVRQPMGLSKKEHIIALMNMPEISSQWYNIYKRNYIENDIENLYNDFIPQQLDIIPKFSLLIPGTLGTIKILKNLGIKIGSTTGYSREIINLLIPVIEKQGLYLDSIVCPDDVKKGRPFPYMCFLNAINLDSFPLESIVKIGDTIVDIQEGLNSGMWTIGIILTGNMVGLTEEQVSNLSQNELKKLRTDIAIKFYKAGAHYVADGIWEIPEIIEKINIRLKNGEKPT